MKKETKQQNSTDTQMGYDTVLCAVCDGSENVEFVVITECSLCKKCRKELSDSFESAMKMDRRDYPEL